jgi:hypothetical protein
VARNQKPSPGGGSGIGTTRAALVTLSPPHPRMEALKSPPVARSVESLPPTSSCQVAPPARVRFETSTSLPARDARRSVLPVGTEGVDSAPRGRHAVGDEPHVPVFAQEKLIQRGVLAPGVAVERPGGRVDPTPPSVEAKLIQPAFRSMRIRSGCRAHCW